MGSKRVRVGKFLTKLDAKGKLSGDELARAIRSQVNTEEELTADQQKFIRRFLKQIRRQGIEGYAAAAVIISAIKKFCQKQGNKDPDQT